MAFFSKVRNSVRVDPRVPKITPTVTATYSAGPNKAMGNPNAAPLGQGGSMGTSDQNWLAQRQPTVSKASSPNINSWIQQLAGLFAAQKNRIPAAQAPVQAPAAPAASPGGLKLSSWTTKAQLPAGQRNRVWF